MTARTPHHALAIVVALVSLAAGSLGGCHHEHLSSNYGQAYGAWRSAQAVNQPPSNPEQAHRNMEGLDAQEASAVSKSYRRASAGKNGDGTEGGGRLLTISPTRAGDGVPYLPPPSVPSAQ